MASTRFNGPLDYEELLAYETDTDGKIEAIEEQIKDLKSEIECLELLKENICDRISIMCNENHPLDYN
jgi:hypothetical protein